MKIVNKRVLTNISSKCYIFADGVTTLPHGHHLLRPIYEKNQNVSISKIYTDEHINELLKIENQIVDNSPMIQEMINRASIERKIRDYVLTPMFNEADLIPDSEDESNDSNDDKNGDDFDKEMMEDDLFNE